MVTKEDALKHLQSLGLPGMMEITHVVITGKPEDAECWVSVEPISRQVGTESPLYRGLVQMEGTVEDVAAENLEHPVFRLPKPQPHDFTRTLWIDSLGMLYLAGFVHDRASVTVGNVMSCARIPGKTLKVLVLDHVGNLRENTLLFYHGIALDVTAERLEDCSDGVRYYLSRRGCEMARSTEDTGFDAIVIGNNEGTGLEKAKLIDLDQRDRAVIVWNQYVPGDSQLTPKNQDDYEKLGYVHFTSRHSIPEFLLKVAAGK